MTDKLGASAKHATWQAARRCLPNVLYFMVRAGFADAPD